LADASAKKLQAAPLI